jgi:large subunit ribosomal protein L11e
MLFLSVRGTVLLVDRCKSRVGIQHRVTKEDAMKWFQVKYEGVILNKSQANTS